MQYNTMPVLIAFAVYYKCNLPDKHTLNLSYLSCMAQCYNSYYQTCHIVETGGVNKDTSYIRARLSY